MTKIDKAFVTLLTLLMIVFVGLVLYSFYEENEYLYKRLEEQRELAYKASLRDSTFIAKNNKLTSELTNYVSDSGCGIIVNDKEISSSELVNILNKTLSENDSLRQELAAYQQNYETNIGIFHENDKKAASYSDSTQVFKVFRDQLKKQYGIKLSYSIEGNTISSLITAPKVDSALWLFPYIRNKIAKNPNTGTLYLDFHKGEERIESQPDEKKGFWNKLFKSPKPNE